MSSFLDSDFLDNDEDMLDLQQNLTDVERRIAEEYVIDMNVNQAAKRLAMPLRHIKDTIALPRVAAYIGILMEDIVEKTRGNAEYVRNALVDVIERCMQREPVMTGTGSRATHAMEYTEDGELVGIYQFDSSGANAALRTLAQINGMLTDSNKRQDDEQTMRSMKSGMTLIRKPRQISEHGLTED